MDSFGGNEISVQELVGAFGVLKFPPELCSTPVSQVGLRNDPNSTLGPLGKCMD